MSASTALISGTRARRGLHAFGDAQVPLDEACSEWTNLPRNSGMLLEQALGDDLVSGNNSVSALTASYSSDIPEFATSTFISASILSNT
jgi:hypothetical protein